VKKIRLSSAPGLKPVVAPEMTITPPGFSDLTLCDQVASPTVSITPSTRPGRRAPVSNAWSAPIATAAARFSSVRPVTHIRKPAARPSTISAVATPPLAPCTRTV
jgi:hypothetical protein